MVKKSKEKKDKKDKYRESKTKRSEEQVSEVNNKKPKLTKEDKKNKKENKNESTSTSKNGIETKESEKDIKVEEITTLFKENKAEIQQSIDKLRVDIQTELNDLKTSFTSQIQQLSQLIETEISSKLKGISNNNPPFNPTTISDPNIIQRNKELEDKNKELQQQLKILNNNNNGLSCSICMNYYHVPHALQCGHTFCFKCLKKWLTNQQKENNPFTCPVCRFKVKIKPNFVRPLHFHIINSLSPEQADIRRDIEKHFLLFNKDKQAWKDIFPESGFLDTLKDEDDDVDRCTRCHWEVVNGVCEHCNFVYEIQDLVLSSEDSDTSTDSDQQGETWRQAQSNYPPRKQLQTVSQIIDVNSTSEGEGESLGDESQDQNDAEQDQDLDTDDSFVCKDDEVSYDSDKSSDSNKIDNSSGSNSSDESNGLEVLRVKNKVVIEDSE